MHSLAWGPAFCSTSTSSGVTSSAGSSMRAARSASEEKTTARPSCSNNLASAEERNEPALRFERLVALRNDRAVDVSGGIACQALAQRLAAHCDAVEMQQRLEFAQQRAHAAGGEEIFHVAVADRLEIDQHGCRIREPVELCERNFHPGAPSDRGEVDHRVGRAAERKKGTQCVLDRFCVDDV